MTNAVECCQCNFQLLIDGKWILSKRRWLVLDSGTSLTRVDLLSRTAAILDWSPGSFSLPLVKNWMSALGSNSFESVSSVPTDRWRACRTRPATYPISVIRNHPAIIDNFPPVYELWFIGELMLFNFIDLCFWIFADRECHEVGKPDKGNVMLTGRLFADRAIYTCDEGYRLVGVEFRLCQADGSWSATEPSCHKNGNIHFSVH